MKYIIREYIGEKEKFRTAVGKARSDIEDIALMCGYEVIEMPMLSPEIAFSHSTHIKVYENWKNNLPDMKKGDELLIQLPLRQHTLLLPVLLKRLKRKGIRIYGLLHDLEIFRLAVTKESSFQEKLRREFEEKKALTLCDAIIAHNKAMKKVLVDIGFEERKIVELEIFDYLTSIPFKEHVFDKTVMIAGNLSKEKAAYIYQIPYGTSYNLYGVNYEETDNDLINYHGSFMPDELPEKVEGSFGLVWDGVSADTCTGAFGQYLKINNPHKTSFYLACGIPVFIWEEAALADFIRENNCGIAIKSLKDIPGIMEKMSEEEYRQLKDNTEIIAVKLQKGFFAEKAIHEAERISGSVVRK